MQKVLSYYSASIPQQNQPVTINYFIWANDTSNNANRTQTYTLNVVDLEPPIIMHTPVTVAWVNTTIKIDATVTDNATISAVYIAYTDVNNANFNNTMTLNGSVYSYSIQQQTKTGTVSYYISAKDSSNNWAATPLYNITIKSPVTDNISPEIVHEPVTEARVNQSINITANVTDNIKVVVVFLNYTTVNGTQKNVEMVNIENSTGYYFEIEPQAVNGTVQYYITAVDSSGNVKRAPANGTYNITITPLPEIDDNPPTIENVTVIPSTVYENQSIIIRAKVTDNKAVHTVMFFFKSDATDKFSVKQMTSVGNDTYEVSIDGMYVKAPMIEYYLLAKDTSNNIATYPVNGSLNPAKIDVKLKEEPRPPESTLEKYLCWILFFIALLIILILIALRKKRVEIQVVPNLRKKKGK